MLLSATPSIALSPNRRRLLWTIYKAEAAQDQAEDSGSILQRRRRTDVGKGLWCVLRVNILGDNICRYIYIHTHIYNLYTYININMNIHIYIYMCTHMSTYIYIERVYIYYIYIRRVLESKGLRFPHPRKPAGCRSIKELFFST